MAAGHQIDRNQINSLLGDVAGNINSAMERMSKLTRLLNRLSDADLTGMGFSQEDLQQLRQFDNRGKQLFNIYSGQATLANTFNFQDAFEKLWGARID